MKKSFIINYLIINKYMLLYLVISLLYLSSVSVLFAVYISLYIAMLLYLDMVTIYPFFRLKQDVKTFDNYLNNKYNLNKFN